MFEHNFFIPKNNSILDKKRLKDPEGKLQYGEDEKEKYTSKPAAGTDLPPPPASPAPPLSPSNRKSSNSLRVSNLLSSRLNPSSDSD